MTVLVVGEALVDLVSDAPPAADAAVPPVPVYRGHPGGGPYNTAVTLGRLGVPARLLARLADDRLGDLLRARADDAGVDLSAVVRAEEPTSLALADVDDEGRASYSFHLTGTSAFSWRAEDLPETLPDVAAVHTGTLALAVDPSAGLLTDWLARLVGGPDRREGPALSLDPNVRPAAVSDPVAYRARLLRLAAVADLVKASDEDLAALYPDLDAGAAAARLRADGARLVVVTAGSGPARAWWDGGDVAQEVPAVAVVDTVGAGDSFVGGLLAALHDAGALRRGLPGLDEELVRTALDAGLQTAAVTVSRAGADPPRRDEVPALATSSRTDGS